MGDAGGGQSPQAERPGGPRNHGLRHDGWQHRWEPSPRATQLGKLRQGARAGPIAGRGGGSGGAPTCAVSRCSEQATLPDQHTHPPSPLP